MYHARDASYRPSERQAPAEWASKHGDKNYALEVAQNPIRARMCGFGDKDRRPLAPAAVAKLVVRDSNDRIVPPESIQVAFFVVLVDLWDEYGINDANLVPNTLLHGSTNRRHRTQRADSQPLAQRHRGSTIETPTSAYPNDPLQLPLGEEPPTSPARETANGSSTGKRKRARRVNGSVDEVDATHNSFEEVPTQPLYAGQDATFHPSTYGQDFMSFNGFYPSTYSAAPHPLAYPSASSSTASGPPMAYEANGAQTSVNDLHSDQPYVHDTTNVTSPIHDDGQEHDNPSDRPTLERARALIGPLAASAQTINDENDEPGIFFLFQDLSVRIEGTFRLRMRLVNVGGPPAPEPGASCVRTETSTVLAQVFTEPFIVFSAKRFPGVPAQTSLSQRLLQQGLKIPGRTRGNTKSGAGGRKRRRVDGDEWVPSGRGEGSGSDEE